MRRGTKRLKNDAPVQEAELKTVEELKSTEELKTAEELTIGEEVETPLRPGQCRAYMRRELARDL